MDVSPASGMRNLPPGEREAARGSVPDRLATGQAVHADAPPTPIVDEALKGTINGSSTPADALKTIETKVNEALVKGKDQLG